LGTRLEGWSRWRGRLRHADTLFARGPPCACRRPLVRGPAGVMALVLAETAAGGAAFLFLTPLWREVKTGFFVLTGVVVLALAGGAGGAAVAGLDPGVAGGRLADVLAFALVGATLVWLALLVGRARRAGRAVGLGSVAVAAAMLFAFARTSEESTALSFFQLLAGAAFTGAVLDGLLLGHWYLTDRRLPRGPINRMAWILVGAVALELAAVVAGGFGSTDQTVAATNSLNPLPSVAGSATLIASGMVACTGLIAVFIQLTLRGTRPTAVQSATGFFYLAVITALTAELAAKIRFLPC